MPRAVMLGLLISGLFFVFVTYVMVQAAHGITPTLEQMNAPLNVMRRSRLYACCKYRSRSARWSASSRSACRA